MCAGIDPPSCIHSGSLEAHFPFLLSFCEGGCYVLLNFFGCDRVHHKLINEEYASNKNKDKTHITHTSAFPPYMGTYINSSCM